MKTICRAVIFALCMTAPRFANAATHKVPADYATIQVAIDAASAGDVVLVDPGTYVGQLKLKPGITLRSVGQEKVDTDRFARAMCTIIDAGGNLGMAPGVEMAEGSQLDGFTVTNVGTFDEHSWQTHFEQHGEQLADSTGVAGAEASRPGVRVRGVACRIAYCVIHHNGDVGIAIEGAECQEETSICHNWVYRNMGGGIGIAGRSNVIVRDNRCDENLRSGIGCRHASPIIEQNECSRNVRAGIGCREGSHAIIRQNRCHRNQRAGIGIRMPETAPLVEDNECFENAMAGIGCRDRATPILRHNKCHHNRAAGIGCADSSEPVVIANQCYENEQAGIGVSAGVHAVIHKNECRENRQVAVGVVGGSIAIMTQNVLSRSGGVPPIVAIRADSGALLHDNELTGGGVAALLVQGRVTAHDNKFLSNADRTGQGIWVWPGATLDAFANQFDGFGPAIRADQAHIMAIRNRCTNAGEA
ncbi:MAG: right-handed parallel beta-helix repeat-containing protein, partial [Planctomycetales bacterium]|nr:right-handed parallel beta-helix repeat-containing protein [Planctomycetales bacterium]